jgi:FkbH-like protein
MQVWIREAELAIIDRVTELVQRTNQLNATTICYSKKEILEFRKSNNHQVYAFNLFDRYGEYGMIGIAIVEEQDHKWLLNSFLFSCRAMGKTVEETLLTYIENESKSNKIEQIIGIFEKTDRNGPIEHIFRQSGFELQNVDDNGKQLWIYDLTKKEPKVYYDWINLLKKEP